MSGSHYIPTLHDTVSDNDSERTIRGRTSLSERKATSRSEIEQNRLEIELCGREVRRSRLEIQMNRLEAGRKRREFRRIRREIGQRRREIRYLPLEFDRITLSVRHAQRETYRRLLELEQPMKEACERQEFFLLRQKDLYRRKKTSRPRQNDLSRGHDVFVRRHEFFLQRQKFSFHDKKIRDRRLEQRQFRQNHPLRTRGTGRVAVDSRQLPRRTHCRPVRSRCLRRPNTMQFQAFGPRAPPFSNAGTRGTACGRPYSAYASASIVGADDSTK